MNLARDLSPDPSPLDEVPVPVGPPPVLDDLAPEAAARLVRYIITSTLERGVAPNAVVALYADLGGDELAVRYADRRFMLRELPSDWSEIEGRVLDLEDSARERGLDLAAAWRRASGVAVQGEDVLEQLARLAGVPAGRRRTERSIYDDPEDLDELENAAEDDYESGLLVALEGRLPELLDLTLEAQQRVRRFAIEERLERGLPPIELLDLYRAFDIAGNDRARQYLDRVYVELEPPLDWLDLKSEAGRAVDLAEAGGRDAGRLFADLLRTSPGIDPVVALRLLMERLIRV